MIKKKKNIRNLGRRKEEVGKRNNKEVRYGMLPNSNGIVPERRLFPNFLKERRKKTN